MLGPSYGEWWKDTPARQRRRTAFALAPGAAILLWALFPYVSGSHLNDDMFEAIERGDAAQFLALLEQGASVSARRGDGATVLHWAVEYDRLESVSIAIQRGADINAADRHGVTPLHQAARSDNGTMVALLLDHGADVDRISPRYDAPLHWAAHAGNPDIVALLLAGGASPDAKDKRDRTALRLAVERGHTDAAELMLAHSVDVNATDRSTGRTLLHRTSIQGQQRLTESLLVHGADPKARDVKGNTALHQAAKRGYAGIVNLLIAYGADPNVATRGLNLSPLHLAVRHRHQETARVLLNAGADVNAHSRFYGTPLHWSAYNGDWLMSRLLIEHGADPGALDDHGLTPRRRADGQGHDALSKVLGALNITNAATAPGLASRGANPHSDCLLPPWMHEASSVFLDAYISGVLSLKEFRRRFSLPNSEYIALGACIAAWYER